MVRRTKEEAQETRTNILNAAVRAFYEKGVTLATLEDIADAAGVTRGALYWHFKNKQEIVAALHDEVHQPLFDMVVEELQKDHPEPLKHMEALYVKILNQLVTDEDKHRILCVFITKCDYTGDMECFLERQTEQKKKAMDLFEEYFEKARKTGHLSADADAKILTTASMCFLSGVCQEYLRHENLFDMKKTGPALVAQFFKGIHA